MIIRLWGHLTGLSKLSDSLKVGGCGIILISTPPHSPPLTLRIRDLGTIMRDLQDGSSVKVANMSVKSLEDQH